MISRKDPDGEFGVGEARIPQAMVGCGLEKVASSEFQVTRSPGGRNVPCNEDGIQGVRRSVNVVSQRTKCVTIVGCKPLPIEETLTELPGPQQAKPTSHQPTAEELREPQPVSWKPHVKVRNVKNP